MLCCFWYIAQASLFSQLPLESVLLWVLWACWTKSVRHMCEGRGSSCKKEAGLPSKCPLLFHKFTRETHQQLWSRKKRQLQDRKRLLRMQAAKILGKVWQSLHEHIYLKILEEHQSFALIFQLVWTGRGSFCKKEAGWVQPCTCHHATLCLRITCIWAHVQDFHCLTAHTRHVSLFRGWFNFNIKLVFFEEEEAAAKQVLRETIDFHS